VPGLLTGLAVADCVRYAVTAAALRRHRLRVLRYDLALLGCVVVVCGVALSAGEHLGAASSKWIKVGVVGGLVLLLWAGVALLARGRVASGWRVAVAE
jgi:hypothetical protein